MTNIRIMETKIHLDRIRAVFLFGVPSGSSVQLHNVSVMSTPSLSVGVRERNALKDSAVGRFVTGSIMEYNCPDDICLNRVGDVRDNRVGDVIKKASEGFFLGCES